MRSAYFLDFFLGKFVVFTNCYIVKVFQCHIRTHTHNFPRRTYIFLHSNRRNLTFVQMRLWIRRLNLDYFPDMWYWYLSFNSMLDDFHSCECCVDHWLDDHRKRQNNISAIHPMTVKFNRCTHTHGTVPWLERDTTTNAKNIEVSVDTDSIRGWNRTMRIVH